MAVINALLGFLVGLFNSLLPALGFSTEFISSIDLAFSWLIALLQSASYFIPLDLFVICLTAMFVFDNWSLLFRAGQWVLKFIRG